MDKYLAPSLARGIAVLRLLEKNIPLSLEEIYQKLGFPKASLFRILETLLSLNLIKKNSQNKYMSNVVLLTFTSPGDTKFENQLKQSLEFLAEKTKCTVEWYVPIHQGLLLLQRAEPQNIEVRVWAKIGFIREWIGELEAVACLGNAWCAQMPRLLDGFWTYDLNGKKSYLTPDQVEEKIRKAASQGYVVDRVFNSNGVRRMASVVLWEERLKGIIALAESYKPSKEEFFGYLDLLLEVANRLSRNTHFSFSK